MNSSFTQHSARNCVRAIPVFGMSLLALGALSARAQSGPSSVPRASSSTSSEQSSTSGTTMFRGGPTHTGVYTSTTTPSLSALAWKFSTSGKFVSSPAIHDNVVFAGNSDKNIYAVNASDGTLKWKFATNGPVTSSPAVSGGLVIASSVDGRIYAIEEATGKQKWAFVTAGERRFTAPGIHGGMPRTQLMADPFDVFLSSPVIADGVVYIGSGDHNVYALDVETGTLKWKFKTGDVVHASPAVANGTVFIGSWDSNFYALDAKTGTMKWKFATGRDTVSYNQVGIASSAAVAGSNVYFGCRDGFLYVLDTANGSLKWKHDNNHGWVIGSPSVHDGVVYFATSDGTRFKALDAATGAIKFNITNKAISFSSPAVVNNAVIFGTSDGWLHSIERTSGNILAEFQTDGSRTNAAKYTNPDGRMNSALMYPDFTLEGMFVGLDRMFTLGSVLSSPVVSNGIVYFGSTDGGLYALK